MREIILLLLSIMFFCSCGVKKIFSDEIKITLDSLRVYKNEKINSMNLSLSNCDTEEEIIEFDTLGRKIKQIKRKILQNKKDSLIVNTDTQQESINIKKDFYQLKQKTEVSVNKQQNYWVIISILIIFFVFLILLIKLNKKFF